jgi:hypothetical protein
VNEVTKIVSEAYRDCNESSPEEKKMTRSHQKVRAIALSRNDLQFKKLSSKEWVQSLPSIISVMRACWFGVIQGIWGLQKVSKHRLVHLVLVLVSYAY